MPVERLCQMTTSAGNAYVELEYNTNNRRATRLTVVCEMPVRVVVAPRFDEPTVIDTTVQAGSTDLAFPTGGRSLTRDVGTSYKTWQLQREMRLGPYVRLEA